VWTKLLNAAAGKLLWSKEKYYKEGVSKIYTTDDPTKVTFNITVSMEAFMVVSYANNLKKYKKMREDIANNAKRGLYTNGDLMLCIELNLNLGGGSDKFLFLFDAMLSSLLIDLPAVRP
jgi:hypothetical protein